MTSDNEYTLDQIRGRPVIDTRGNTLGDVQDVTFDPTNWEVRNVLVNLRKEIADDLRIDKPTFGNARLSVSRERVQTLGENVILNVNTDDIAMMLRGGAPTGTAAPPTGQTGTMPPAGGPAPGPTDRRV